ncbi:MAG TPA: hypothetical protein TECP_01060 [Hyphomicrobiaceae bacterium MAG_BT-2024]
MHLIAITAHNLDGLAASPLFVLLVDIALNSKRYRSINEYSVRGLGKYAYRSSERN